MPSIRQLAVMIFSIMLPRLDNMSGTEFRREFIEHMMNVTRCTLACAATHYNSAFKQQLINDPHSVEKLRRRDFEEYDTTFAVR